MAALNKHLEKAERLIHKGKLEDALEELLLARKELPADDLNMPEQEPAPGQALSVKLSSSGLPIFPCL